MYYLGMVHVYYSATKWLEQNLMNCYMQRYKTRNLYATGMEHKKFSEQLNPLPRACSLYLQYIHKFVTYLITLLSTCWYTRPETAIWREGNTMPNARPSLFSYFSVAAYSLDQYAITSGLHTIDISELLDEHAVRRNFLWWHVINWSRWIQKYTDDGRHYISVIMLYLGHKPTNTKIYRRYKVISVIMIYHRHR